MSAPLPSELIASTVAETARRKERRIREAVELWARLDAVERMEARRRLKAHDDSRDAGGAL